MGGCGPGWVWGLFATHLSLPSTNDGTACCSLSYACLWLVSGQQNFHQIMVGGAKKSCWGAVGML